MANEKAAAQAKPTYWSRTTYVCTFGQPEDQKEAARGQRDAAQPECPHHYVNSNFILTSKQTQDMTKKLQPTDPTIFLNS